MDQITPHTGPKLTASELIDALKKLPPDIPVVVRGYMGGFADAQTPKLQKVARDVHSDGYRGPHDASEDGEYCAVIANFGGYCIPG